jgi:hypothetical protein
MNATHWLLGCVLCVAGLGSAAAASMDTQDTDGSSHAASDVVSAHDASGGDVAGLNHDVTAHSSGADVTTGNTGNDTSHSGGTSSAPVHVRPSHLGWQSLLPGSIQ